MTNLKAVIPVAGLGMYMLPATKAIPKEMLPIVDKPMIQYIVDEIVAAGIKEILTVTHASKNAVENHFDTSYELESLLEQRVKRQLLAEVQSICPPGVTIMNVRQGEPLGLGHSILCARPAIGDNPFVVVLPDVVIDDASADPLRYNLAAMIARFNETGRSRCWQNVCRVTSLNTLSSRPKSRWTAKVKSAALLNLSKNRISRRRWTQTSWPLVAMCFLPIFGRNWNARSPVHGAYSAD